MKANFLVYFFLLLKVLQHIEKYVFLKFPLYMYIVEFSQVIMVIPKTSVCYIRDDIPYENNYYFMLLQIFSKSFFGERTLRNTIRVSCYKQ